MIEFYRNHFDFGMTKAEALRQAQLAMMYYADKDGALPPVDKRPKVDPRDPKTRRNPLHYWAGFMLSGDWR
jgi:CHAT domain-containing protein